VGEQEASGETEGAKAATGAVNSPWPGRRSSGPPHLHLRRHHDWQIELCFKRMKSLLGLGALPKKREDSCRAWLHGKLLIALLLERLLDEAEHFSPWGYELDAQA
jgi:hypothetical protein